MAASFFRAKVTKETHMVFTLRIVLWVLFGFGALPANAAPAIELGAPGNYCVVYCYIRVPFTIADYALGHKIGRVFCDFDAEVSSRLPVYNGETRAKNIQATAIGVFKSDNGVATGDVEISTGIIKQYFVSAKVNSVHCRL